MTNISVFWLTMVKKSTDYDGGIGQSEYIYGEGKFNSYMGLKCIYAVEISKEFSIVKVATAGLDFRCSSKFRLCFI